MLAQPRSGLIVNIVAITGRETQESDWLEGWRSLDQRAFAVKTKYSGSAGKKVLEAVLFRLPAQYGARQSQRTEENPVYKRYSLIHPLTRYMEICSVSSGLFGFIKN